MNEASKSLRLSCKRVFMIAIALCLTVPAIQAQKAFAATLDVTAYGANGSDSANDRTAIQNAINAASSGDTVYFPAGTYYINDALVPKSGIRLNGASKTTSIIKFNGTSDSAMIEMAMSANISNVEVSNLTLNGNSDPQAIMGIEAHKGTGHHFHDLIIKNFTGPDDEDFYGPFGIWFEGASGDEDYINGVTNSTIENNTFTDIGVDSQWGSAVRMGWGSTGNKVMNNTITNTGRGGIFAHDGSTNSIISGNTITGSGKATDPEPGEGLSIEVWGGSGHAVIEDNDVDHWISLDESDYSAVRRNTVASSGSDIKFIGLEAAGTSNNVFTNNTVDGGQQIGISVSNDGNKQHILWAYNTVQNMVQWGAQIQGDTGGAQYQYFYKNKFLTTQNDNPNAEYPGDDGHGFRVNGGTTYFTFDGNEFKNNDTVGVQIVGSGINSFSFVNNVITGNGDESVDAYPTSAANLEWSGNTVSGNGTNVTYTSRGFSGNAKPTANFTAPSTGTVGTPITFTNTSTDPNGPIGYSLWDFGASTPSTSTSPSFVYTVAGTYKVTLVVWDAQGRSSLKEKTIVIS